MSSFGCIVRYVVVAMSSFYVGLIIKPSNNGSAMINYASNKN